jgi:LuxR family transcriptional regulator, maltose regulon positive regulatory protein
VAEESFAIGSVDGRPSRRASGRRSGSGTVRSILLPETKFHAPKPRPGHVSRALLIHELINATDKRMVLIDAPAGYGKSTLLAEWIASDKEARPFAWISLDQGDNDALRLATYLIDGIRRIVPGFADDWRNKTGRHARDLETRLIPRLVAELATLPRRIVLVLDDYHELRNEECHRLVELLFEGLPSTTQLVISTRSDPPVALGRTRAMDGVLEIREPQLRFDEDEAARLLENATGSKLGSDDLQVLVDKTEGWPAGLYLAALSIRDGHDTGTFVMDFAGTNRHIVEYLSAEVLGKQPTHLQQFLIETSILNRFSAQLCDAILDTNGSARLLADLQRSNLFLVALDDHQEWYRYHHLFGDLLRSQLALNDPQLSIDLHRRAASWHRRWGYIGESIEHAIEGDDLAAAKSLIAESWLSYMAAGHLFTVTRWLSMIGDVDRAADPTLAIISAWVSAAGGQWVVAQQWLTEAARSDGEVLLPDGLSVKTSADLLRASYGFGGFSEAHEAAQRAVRDTAGNFRWYPYSEFLFGLTLRWSGHLTDAVQHLETALSSNAEVSSVFLNETLSALAISYCDQGRLSEAEELAREARVIVEEHGLDDTILASASLTAMGRVLADRGELHEASRSLEEVLVLRRSVDGQNPWATIEAMLTLAPVRFARGDRDGAKELLKESRRLLKSHPDGGMLQTKLDKEERMLYRRDRPPITAGEVLTDREMAVLRLLPSRLSQREIGDELFLSLNTIKSHVRAIFRKLDATSRREAVDTSRKLGLI